MLGKISLWAREVNVVPLCGCGATLSPEAGPEDLHLRERLSNCGVPVVRSFPPVCGCLAREKKTVNPDNSYLKTKNNDPWKWKEKRYPYFVHLYSIYSLSLLQLKWDDSLVNPHLQSRGIVQEFDRIWYKLSGQFLPFGHIFWPLDNDFQHLTSTLSIPDFFS